MIALHAFAWGNRAKLPLNSPIQQVLENNSWLSKLCGAGGSCVAIFLFITGLGMMLSKKSVAGTMLNSLTRFWKMYLPSVLLGGILLMFFPAEYPDNVIRTVGIREMILGFCGYGNAICGEWWYAKLFLISVIFLFPAARFVFGRCRDSGIGALTAFIIMQLIWAAWVAFARLGLGEKDLMTVWAYAFACGCLAARLNFSTSKPVVLLRNFRRKSFSVRAGTAAVILIPALTVSVMLYGRTFIYGAYKSVDCAAILFAVWALISEKTHIGKALAFLGKYSGWMWLNHSFFLYYYLRDELFALESVPVIFVAAVGLSLAAAMIESFVFGKFWNVLSAGFSRLKKTQNPA